MWFALGASCLPPLVPDVTSTITGAAGEGLGLDPMIFMSAANPLPALLLSLG